VQVDILIFCCILFGCLSLCQVILSLTFAEIWCQLLRMVNWLCGMDILPIRYVNFLTQ